VAEIAIEVTQRSLVKMNFSDKINNSVIFCTFEQVCINVTTKCVCDKHYASIDIPLATPVCLTVNGSPQGQ